jgi:hypothetical protein
VLLAGAGEKVEKRLNRSGNLEKLRTRIGMSAAELAAEQERLRAAEKRMGEIPFGRMLRFRVRYFTDRAVIGSPEVSESGFRGITLSFQPEAERCAKTAREP